MVKFGAPLSHLFLLELERISLVDLEPIDIKPTWVNNRNEEDVMSKRLDFSCIHKQFSMVVGFELGLKNLHFLPFVDIPLIQ